MKKIKKIKNQLIGIDKKNNIFLLNGNGIWQEITNTKLFKLMGA